jgi:glucose/arabinose dehydrogenase
LDSIAHRAVRRLLPAAACVAVVALAGCAATDPPTSVTETGATLNGHVNPFGKPTAWWFEYGKTKAYGSSTPRGDAGSGDVDVPVSARVTGLTPATVYHFRVCNQPQGGAAACGVDVSFTTVSDKLPAGFSEHVDVSGLTQPTAVRYAADGRMFVAEKSGIIKVYDGPGDATPTTFADLRTETHNFWDRGLLGLALDPGFPAKPYVYVAYTHDAAIGGTAPRWGAAGATSDGCPTPPGPTSDGCVASGRVSRLTADGDVAAGPEQVLVEDWCQQFPSHSIGSLAFGRDGALYASGGDGASFTAVDYGQFGSPRNPCDDPPGGSGQAMTPPAAEGGALRAQDVRSSGDPAGLDGTVIRIDPQTGESLPDNPGAGDADRNMRRIVATGLRNPFRIASRPGSDEVWIGDVGWDDFEELDRLATPTGATATNFGWPCFEGPGRQPAYDAAQLGLCETLYANGGQTAPFASYAHSGPVVAGDGCPTGTSAVAGLAFGFYPSGPYPAEYDGALFFADHSRNCIWVMKRDGSALPNPSTLIPFKQGAANPVDLQMTPSGELSWVDFDGGTIRRITYAAGNRPPIAVATADRTSGAVPLTVAFDGSTSDDPDSSAPLSFAWDLDGDGQFDDSTAARPTSTYTTAGTRTATLRVTDAGGVSATDAVTITAGNTPPTAAIASPSPGVTWRVGDRIRFDGAATDEQDGALPPSALSWSLVLHHCPAGCHTHGLQSWPGTDRDSFVTPDHDYPSYLELRLTATDSGGLQDTQTVRLDPRTVRLTVRSSPTGLTLGLGGSSGPAPLTRTVIEGSQNTISAPSPQTLGGASWAFGSWSDGGARSHDVIAGADDATYTATFASG